MIGRPRKVERAERECVHVPPASPVPVFLIGHARAAEIHAKRLAKELREVESANASLDAVIEDINAEARHGDA